MRKVSIIIALCAIVAVALNVTAQGPGGGGGGGRGGGGRGGGGAGAPGGGGGGGQRGPGGGGGAAPGGARAGGAPAGPAGRAELQPIMADIQTANGGLTAAITAMNASDAAIQTAKLGTYFSEAAAIFAKEKVDDATKMSIEIADAAGDMAKAARAGTVPDAAKVKAAIGKCGTCHGAHREGDAKTGYKLKK